MKAIVRLMTAASGSLALLACTAASAFAQDCPDGCPPAAAAVPEINASTGLAALAVLAAVALIVRELFFRRRTA